MNCPESFTVRVQTRSKKPISNLIVYLEIFAKRKNNYGIGPRMTNMNGEIIVTKKMIEEEIEESIKTFLMDYSSRLIDCEQEIAIEICDMDKLKKILTNLKKYYPENVTSLEDLIVKSNNHKILPLKAKFEVLFENNSVINVFVDIALSDNLN